MIYYLRLFALIEGISLLILFFVAMPLKYYFDLPQAVTYVGWVHGLLFMGFVLYAGHVAQKHKFSDKLLLMVLLSSMLPFGMVVLDRKLKQI